MSCFFRSTPNSYLIGIFHVCILQLFDMKKFQSNVNRELRRAYPDRRRLETQCLSLVAFVKSENDILDCPIWVLIVNVVAMDMLKSKLPPGECCRTVNEQKTIQNNLKISWRKRNFISYIFLSQNSFIIL